MLDQFRAQKIEWNRANNQIYDRVETSSGDSNGRTLFVQISNGGTVEDLTGATLSLAWSKRTEQGLETFEEVDAKKGQYRLFYPTGMLVNHGVLQASLVLVDVTGRIESKPFDIIVHKGTVDDEAVESDNKFTALTTALVKVSQVQAEFDGLYADKSQMMDTLHDDKKADMEALEADYSNRANTLEATYAPRLTEVSAQLAQTSTQQNYFMGSVVRDMDKPKNGIVVFVTDDANTQDYTLYKPLFESNGVPFCTAVIASKVGMSGFCTKEQLLEIQASGHEILSHTYSHPYLASLTAEQIESDFVNSHNWFEQNGLQVESIAYPFGSYNETVKEVARKHFRSGRSSAYGLSGLNDAPIETFELKSLWLDSNVHLSNDPSGFNINTLDYYKYYIDKAFERNAMLIISTHSWDIEKANLTQLLSDIISYAKTKCEVTTLSQALDKMGNIIDTGSFGRTNPHVSHFSIGYDGTVSTNQFDTVYAAENTYTGVSHIDDFNDYKITVNRVNTVEASSSGLPESVAGVLYTYKIIPRIDEDFSFYNYQIYHVIHGNIYKRVVKSNRDWNEWRKVNNSLEVTGELSTLSDGINYYSEGLTINYIGGANGSITPTGGAGTLLTFKVTKASDNALSYQEFSQYNGSRKFKRYPTSPTSWTSWTEVSSRDSYPSHNAYTGSSPITSFAMGVTYNTVTTPTATSSALPEGIAGTLITYKIDANDHAYNYQTYHIYGTAKLYKRSFATDGTPKQWEKISVV